MHILMNGRVLSLYEFDPLTDKAFCDLHGSYLGNIPYKWEDFEQIAIEFFNGSGNGADNHDKFFTNFTIIWRNFLDIGNLNEAERIWERALRPAFAWEKQHPNGHIHKGTPFYFWGMTSILKGDLDRGYALMHRSVEEDCQTTGKQYPDTPGFALATLNFTKTDQAFREWVILQANHLSGHIASYCNAYSRTLGIDEIRRRFLSNPPSRDTVFLFVYTLAKLSNVRSIPSYALESNFAGQFEMNLLFDMSLVIDSAIKAKNSTQWRFQDHAAFLANKAGIGLGKDKLDEINDNFKNNFDQTLKRILSCTFTFNDKTSLNGLAGDLAVTYGLRNYAAHNVTSVSTIWKEFEVIQQKLFDTLFLAIETLY